RCVPLCSWRVEGDLDIGSPVNEGHEQVVVDHEQTGQERGYFRVSLRHGVAHRRPWLGRPCLRIDILGLLEPWAALPFTLRDLLLPTRSLHLNEDGRGRTRTEQELPACLSNTRRFPRENPKAATAHKEVGDGDLSDGFFTSLLGSLKARTVVIEYA